MSERFVALDRLRSLAVVLMVQGHTFSALLREGALTPGLASLHALVHGLTAPAFLFGAGLAFGIASYPRYEELRASRALQLRRVRRSLGLLLLGYALQLPGASLQQALRLRGEALAPVLRVGPLQLVAVCLLLTQLLTIVRSPRRHASLCGALGLVLAGLAPWLYAARPSPGPALAPWLDDRTGSLFPLFPWASFALLGVAAAYPLALGPVRARVWLAAGVALSTGSYLLYRTGILLSERAHFWKASPVNMAFRAGLVLCLIAALHLGARREQGALSRLARALARHSLVAYVCHLLLLYGSPFTRGLVREFGRRLELPAACAAFAGVMLGTTAITVGWSLAREKRVLDRRWLVLAAAGSSLLVLAR